jgi:hypothetical protein
MRLAPGRSRGHLWLVAAEFYFFNLCSIGSVGFDDRMIDYPLASILFASASFGCDCCADAYQQIVKKYQNNTLFLI